MEIYNNEIMHVIRTRLIPKMQRVSLEIAMIEPYSYAGADLQCLQREFEYYSMLYDFLYEYASGTEELSNDKLINIVRLIEVPDSERKLSNATVLVPINTKVNTSGYRLFINDVEVTSSTVVEQGTTISIRIEYTSSRYISGTKSLRVEVDDSGYTSGSFTYIGSTYVPVSRYGTYIIINAMAYEEDKSLDGGAEWGVLVGAQVAPEAPVATDALSVISTSFIATWETVTAASDYFLDVATDINFTSMVPGYDDLLVGSVLAYPVVGLDVYSTYYYRVRAGNDVGVSNNSNTITVFTKYRIKNGYLYNHAAIEDPRNMAPIGFHVPTEAELITLQEYLGGELEAGGHLKSTDPDVWNSPNEGADNTSEFSAFGSGLRLDDGSFNGIKDYALFWQEAAASVVGLTSITSAFSLDTVDNNCGISVRFIKDETIDIKYGRLYNWYAVNTGNLAPTGWHVPTKEDWETLETALGGTFVAGGKMKSTDSSFWSSPNIGATNSSGWSAVGGGTRSPAVFNYRSINEYTSYLSSSDYGLGVSVYQRTLLFDEEYLGWGPASFNTALSVRLIKDDSVDTGTMTDIDGNIYPTIKIGDQVWMAENLRTTKYNNGISIPEITDDAAWEADTAGAMCTYNNLPLAIPFETGDTVTGNDEKIYDLVQIGTQVWTKQNSAETKYRTGFLQKYGALYNWYAASKANMFDDWFVPSQEELLPMLPELKSYGLGGFKTDIYACSTESTIYSSNVVVIQFTSGGLGPFGATKTMSLRVRLCRSFTSSILYNKRDIGPAGGYIYIVIDNLNGTYTYYEAYFEDVVMMMTNITTAAGATGTAIGTGQSNCNLYLAQAGINDGAVLFADNLEYEYGSAIAPSGWHVPTQAEFETLITYLGGESVAGGHLKESGTAHWNIESTGADNSSGFTALGSGVRYDDGSFAFITEAIQMYHSDIVPDITSGDQIAKHILSDSDSVLISNVSGIGLNTGNSLRLIKDDSTDPGTVTDIDGNIYPTVKIGDQVWMKSNLIVTHYGDGTSIPIVADNAAWAALGTNIDTSNTRTSSSSGVATWAFGHCFQVITPSILETITIKDNSYISKTGSPDFNIRVSIYNTAVFPNGGMNSIPTTEISNTNSTNTVHSSLWGVGDNTFTFDGIELQAGIYAFVFKYENIVLNDSSNKINYGYGNSQSTNVFVYRVGTNWLPLSGSVMPMIITFRPDAMCYYNNNINNAYINDDNIPVVTDNTEWASLTTDARCSYDNDETNAIL